MSLVGDLGWGHWVVLAGLTLLLLGLGGMALGMMIDHADRQAGHHDDD